MANLTLQEIAQGFGSYLKDILPADVAVGAGAFSASLRQVKNVENMKIEKLGTVVYNIETTKNLNVNGDGLPTNSSLAQSTINSIAKGNGPYSTYTMSNFLGCMSGLPYLGNFQTTQELVNGLSTPWLQRTYDQLYLAVSWGQATGTVTYSTYNVKVQDYNPGIGQPRIDNWYYTITGGIVTNSGGGYSREQTPYYGSKALDPSYPITSDNFAPSGQYAYTTPPNFNPLVILTEHYGSSGTVLVTTVDSDSKNTNSTYGQVTSIVPGTIGAAVLYYTTSVMSYDAPTTPTVLNPPTIVIQAPPITIESPPDYASNEPAGTSGWPTMISVVSDYIERANIEILGIKLRSEDLAERLNTSYNNCGNYLSIEQESRSLGLTQLPPQFNVTRETNFSSFPLTLTTFVDTIPKYSLNTDPHMYAQTLEAITSNDIGGQSVIGLARETRNQTRLTTVGISLDNTILDSLTKDQQKELLYNGVLPLEDGMSLTPPATLATSYTDVPEIITSKDGVIPDQYNLPNDYGSGPIPSSLIVKNSQGGIVGVGALNKNPYLNNIPPSLSTTYTQQSLGSSTYNISEAIDQVVACNCSCWDDL